MLRRSGSHSTESNARSKTRDQRDDGGSHFFFIEPAGLKTVEEFYERFTRKLDAPEEIIYRSKRLTLATSMAGELHVLALRLDRISEQHRWSRDFTLNLLRHALREVIACFPVYLTYIKPMENNRGTAVKKREDTHRMAEANKAFAHYRW